MSTELVEFDIDEQQYPQMFTTGGLDQFIEKIRESITEVPDATTTEGRKRIKAVANQIAKSKKAIENRGRAYNKTLKELPKIVDAELRKFVNEVDSIKNEFRKPLTEFEDAEKQRIQDLDDRLSMFEYLARTIDENETKPLGIDQLNANLIQLQGIAIDRTWQEFQKLATDKRERYNRRLINHIEKVCAANAKEEEVERLKRVEQEQAQLLREQHLVAEAKKDAAITAEQEKQQAIKKERDRIYSEEIEKGKKDALRQADTENKRQVNNEALSSFLANGYSESEAKHIIKLIIKGAIKNVTINY